MWYNDIAKELAFGCYVDAFYDYLANDDEEERLRYNNSTKEERSKMLREWVEDCRKNVERDFWEGSDFKERVWPIMDKIDAQPLWLF